MNTPHLQQVLEDPNPALTLDMGLHLCCISGYVAVELVDRNLKDSFEMDEAAARYLGLNKHQASELFYPMVEDFPDWSTITRAQAAQAVRNVMAGNPPNWEDILNADL